MIRESGDAIERDDAEDVRLAKLAEERIRRRRAEGTDDMTVGDVFGHDFTPVDDGWEPEFEE